MQGLFKRYAPDAVVEHGEDSLQELPPRHPPQLLAVLVEGVDLVEAIVENHEQGRHAVVAHLAAELVADLGEALRGVQQHDDREVDVGKGDLKSVADGTTF